tara:strand:- start:3315 stop:3695 length:381 start_codon:yes stop_codon:yes gene_type:complete
VIGRFAFFLFFFLTISFIFVYFKIYPAFIYAFYGDEYKEMMFNCDHAMREHYIAKKNLEIKNTEINIKNLQATELGLLKCHEYDKKRKFLISKGLSENDLQILGLEALEEKQYELRDFVEIHEFRY